MESVLSGFSSVSNISGSRLEEEQFLLGHTKLGVVLSQLMLVSTTLYLAKEACGWSEVPLSARYSFYALSTGTALALHLTEPPKDQLDKNRALRRGLFAIHRNIGRVCEWTAFGAALSVTARGSRIEGGITAALIAAGYLHRSSLTPKSLDKPYQAIVLAREWLGVAWVFGYGSRSEKILYGAILAACYAQPDRAIDDIRIPTYKSTWQDCIATDDEKTLPLTDDNGTFKLNWDHIEAAMDEKLPAASADIKIEDLTEYENWFEEHDDQAKRVLIGDDRWEKDPEIDRGKGPAAFLKQGLKKLIAKTSGNDPSFVGKPAEMEQLRNLLRLFIEKLSDESIEESARAQALCQLGAHGHYCGDGYLGMTQHIYFYLTGNADKLTFKDAVHRLLAEERKRLFDVAMNKMLSGFSAVGLNGLVDPGIVENQFGRIREFGPLCGHPWLQTARAASGTTSLLVPAVERIVRIISGSQFLKEFYSDYQPTSITKLVHQAHLENRIKNPVIWQALEELCQENTTYNIDYAFDDQDKLKHVWIERLLAHYGIFKYVKK
jgi:hypothetical protein